MVRINKKNYRYNRAKKIHMITFGENHYSSCIFCEEWFNESPIEFFDSSTEETYQLPYCSRKCQVEDPDGDVIKNKVIELCNSYKNDNIKEQEKRGKARKKKLEEMAQTERINSAIEEEQRNKEKINLGLVNLCCGLCFLCFYFIYTISLLSNARTTSGERRNHQTRWYF